MGTIRNSRLRYSLRPRLIRVCTKLISLSHKHTHRVTHIHTVTFLQTRRLISAEWINRSDYVTIIYSLVIATRPICCTIQDHRDKHFMRISLCAVCTSSSCTCTVPAPRITSVINSWLLLSVVRGRVPEVMTGSGVTVRVSPYKRIFPYTLSLCYSKIGTACVW